MYLFCSKVKMQKIYRGKLDCSGAATAESSVVLKIVVCVGTQSEVISHHHTIFGVADL